MNKNKLLYNLINVFFLFSAILMVNYTGILKMKFSIIQLVLLIFIFMIVHIFKFIRIYFILLEEKTSIKRMIKVYIKTTFVSVVYPYKIGELFKMCSYGNEIKNYPKGIIAVLIDKFFDAVILCTILIMYAIDTGSKVSALAIILLLFIISILIIYFSFESTYYYLNKFFIIKNNKRRNLIILNVLEKLNIIYKDTKEMVSGRNFILLIITSIIWLLEFIFIYIMAIFLEFDKRMEIIINYITDSFFGIDNVLFNNYLYLCAVFFLGIIIIIYVKKMLKKVYKFEKNSIGL